MELRVALSLAVTTTVFAFLANSLSPLPPLRTFGATLGLGVVSAFLASTVTVGAMHVFVERTMGASRSRGLELGNLQREQQNSKGEGPYGPTICGDNHSRVSSRRDAGLDTSFELTDFLSEDEMEIMEVREDLYESYEVNALKSVYILVEPSEGESSFDSEEG